jgi:hypothetical protein
MSAILARMIQGEATVAAAMPAGEATLRWLQTPFRSRTKARRVLPSLLDIQLPFPVEECRCVYPRTEPSDDGSIRALAVAVRETDMARRLDRLGELGLDPTHLDHEALALWEGVDGPDNVTSPEYRIVVYLSPDRVSMASGAGRRLVSAHGLRWSGARSDLSALLPRMAHILRSQCSDPDRPVVWWWTGPLAGRTDLVDEMERDLASRRAVRFVYTEDPASHLARCLATRAMREDASGWNLRGGGWEHPSLRRKRDRRDVRQIVAGLGLGAMLIALNAGWKTVLDRRNRALDHALREVAAELTGLPERAIEPGLARHVVETHLREPGRPKDPFVRSLRGGAAEPLFQAVQEAWRLQLNLTQVEFQQGRLTVRGNGPNEATCRDYAASLEEEGGVVSLDLEGAGSEGRIRFVLSGEFDDE